MIGRTHLRGLEVGPRERQAGLGLDQLGFGHLDVGRTDGLQRGQLGLGLIERIARLLILERLIVDFLARAGRSFVERRRSSQVALGGLDFGRPAVDERFLRLNFLDLGPGQHLSQLGPGDTDLCLCLLHRGLAATIRIEYGHDLPGFHPLSDVNQKLIDAATIGAACRRHLDHFAVRGQPTQSAHADRNRARFDGLPPRAAARAQSASHPRPPPAASAGSKTQSHARRSPFGRFFRRTTGRVGRVVSVISAVAAMESLL